MSITLTMLGTVTGVYDVAVTNNGSTATITLYDSIKSNSTLDYLFDSALWYPSSASWYSGATYGTGVYYNAGEKHLTTGYRQYISRSYTVNLDHSTHTYTFKAYLSCGNDYAGSDQRSGTFNVTIPAKQSWTVSYNANGGSGAPGNQTKWHNEALTLSSTVPTRAGYTFVRWNTNSSGTGTSYNSGASYTGNGALTLYAVWSKNLNMTEVSAVRVGSDGETASQVGGRLKVSFGWRCDTTASGDFPSTFSVTAVPSNSSLPTVSGVYDNSGGPFTGSAHLVIGDSETYHGETVYRAIRPDVTYTVTVVANSTNVTSAMSYSLPAATSAEYSKPTVTVNSSRSTIGKSHDICGEYVYLTASYTSYTDLYRFVASFEGGAEKGFLYDSQEKTGDVLLGPYTTEQLRPENAYTASVSITDKFYTTVVSKAIPKENAYVPPTVTITKVDRVTSDGVTPDALGGYVRISGTYAMTETETNSVPSASRSLLSDAPNGSQIAEGSNVVNTMTRTFSRLFGMFPLSVLRPDAVYYVTSDLSDRFNTTRITAVLPASTTQQGGYIYPSISEVNPYRIGADLLESDDGTDFRIDVNWSIYSSMTQVKPEAFNVRIVSEEGITVFEKNYDYAVTSGNPSIIYVRAEEGEEDLFSQDLQYTVTVTVMDRYSIASLSAIVTSAFFTWDAKRGGHGIAFGKPSTREIMDVRFPGYFDSALHIAEELSLPVYVREKLPKSVVPSLPAIVIVSSGSSRSVYLATRGTQITAESFEAEMHTVKLNYDAPNSYWDPPNHAAAFEWPCTLESGNPGWYSDGESDSGDENPYWWTCVELPIEQGSFIYNIIDAYLETDTGAIRKFVPETGNGLNDYIVSLNPNNWPLGTNSPDLDLDPQGVYFHFKHFEGCGWHPDSSEGKISGTFHVVYEVQAI